jgi:hypothetical protein
LFGEVECSLTAATWLLCLVTSAAFIAAYNAARYALQTYQVAARALLIEQSVILSQRICRKSEHYIDPALEYTLSAEGYLTNGRLDRSLEHEFDAVDYEFVSLGRSPIVSGRTELFISFVEAGEEVAWREPAHLPSADLGDYRADESKHARLWISSELFPKCSTIDWKRAASCDAGPLDFRALPPGRPDAPEPRLKRNLSLGLQRSERQIEEASAAIRPDVPIEPIGEVLESKPHEL